MSGIYSVPLPIRRTLGSNVLRTETTAIDFRYTYRRLRRHVDPEVARQAVWSVAFATYLARPTFGRIERGVI